MRKIIGMVTFDAIASGDMECFCWDQVEVIKATKMDQVKREVEKGRLYPEAAFSLAGLDRDYRYDKKFRFTIIIEEETAYAGKGKS